MRELLINGVRIADDEPCFVIAELGNNHGGSVTTAAALIKQAAAAGASAVKLQKRTIEACYTPQLLASPYANEHSYGATYGEHRRALEFDWQAYVSCRAVAKGCGLTFFATAFDEEAADFLMQIGVPGFKIASGDLTNTPLLKHCAKYGLPVIVSTGGGSIADIDRAMEALGSCPRALLHCTASYPLDAEQAHLRVIPALRQRYPETVIGWSSHSPGIALSLVAYAFGARIIEQHVTLSRAAKGTDHGFSLEPKGLQTLVDDLAKVRAAQGLGEKVRLACEAAPLRKMAKSLVGARDLPVGHRLTAADLARKSPADGMPPYLIESLVGFPLAKPLAQDELLTEAHLSSVTHA